ncbi:MAG TPA: response regulator [Kofleriaceae bacterium]|nr:response regulator [Kofleriaceae bacterium]
MRSVLLHVEDDPMLRTIVQMSFENLGFRGTVVFASTIHEARQHLAAPGERTFDLVISDMHLPDGTGLDVVRLVRQGPHTAITPVVILSGDVNPKTVGRAYMLGANVYLDKAAPGRTLSDVIRSLYQHWILDAVPAQPERENAGQAAVSRAITLRARHARLYQKIADRFGPDDPAECAFWLGRTLAESNLANVLDFVRHQLAGVELPASTSDDIMAMQEAADGALRAAERELEAPATSRVDAYRSVLDLLLTINIDALSRAIAELFPVMPNAMAAVHEFLVGVMSDVVAWVSLKTDDPALQQRVCRLRDGLMTLTGARR